jgi:murein DD-endopeptidase MepM/ murein hydrolase activator NlpD
MGNHRADKRTRTTSAAPARTAVRGGKRKATRARTPLAGSKLPLVPTMVGAAALGLAGTSAAVDHGMNTPSAETAVKQTGLVSGSISKAVADRTKAISRDNERSSVTSTATDQLQESVDAQAMRRTTALKQLGNQANERNQEIIKNLWHLPTDGYRLTARFGMSSGLWSHNHTGLDFAGPSGSSIYAVANGTIVSTEYDGAYGNKTIERLDDGTEIWYCHQSAFKVSVGERVVGGQSIGSLGSTGNTTGPHVHVEVRPLGGDPIDPYAAFVAHGVTP